MQTETSHKKTAIELVDARVSKTRREIKLLESQLMKLISDGKKKTDLSEIRQDIASMRISEAVLYNNEVETNSNYFNSEIKANRAKTFKDHVAEIITSSELVPKHNPNITVRRREKSPPIHKEECPKKILHYDRKAVREYIKMKRKKEMQSMINVKKQVMISRECKKQKLQELHRKSLDIVSKNIKHKQEKCKAAALDIQKPTEDNINQKLTDDNINQEIINGNKDINRNEENVTKNAKASRLDLKNITLRSNINNLGLISFLNKHMKIYEIDASQQMLDAKHKAATKIQAAFKGYLQRRLYKIMKLEQKSKVTRKEVHTTAIKDHFSIFQPSLTPYPYNFINAVRMKLNLAVRQKNQTTKDMAIPNSPNGSNKNEQLSGVGDKTIVREISDISLKVPQKSDIKEDLKENCNEQNIKSLSHNKNTDLKSFLSHKCLNLDVKLVEPLDLTRKSTETLKHAKSDAQSDSDTSKNIPDISSEGSINETRKHSNKRSHSSDTDKDNKLPINMDRVKKLKLLRPKKIDFSNEHLVDSKLSESIKENLDVNDEPLTQNIFLARDSIISFNKCDYSSFRKESSGELKPSISNKSTGDPSICDTLTSFRNYMNNLDKSDGTIEESKEKSLSFRNSMNNLDKSDEVIEDSKEKSLSFRNSMNNLDKSDRVIEDSKEKSLSFRNYMNSLDKSDGMIEESKEKSLSIRMQKDDPFQNSSKSLLSIQAQNSTITTENVTATIHKEQEYSSNFTSVVSSAASLKPPSISLKRSNPTLNSSSTKSLEIAKHSTPPLNSSLQQGDPESEDDSVIDVNDTNKKTNIILKPGRRVEKEIKTNQIHLKFEAELHLLNEFNDSLRQVMEVERSLLELHNKENKKQEEKVATTYQTQDTQTSLGYQSLSDAKISTTPLHLEKKIDTINYTRGSEPSEDIDIFSLDKTFGISDSSLMTTGLELSQVKESLLASSVEESNVDVDDQCKGVNLNGNGLSLKLFEQLIKDEDARIENLKTILKIREKALVDRTKGELAWLEIQKKHLRDSGQLQEISAIKKKQRGLLIKLEHERHEMQRLKQMQKAASKERKSALRGQRNMFKSQLSNAGNMITKIKRNTKEEKRHSGPLRVYNIKSHSESIRSETSMSRRSSVTEEIVSIISHSHSIVSHVTEDAVVTADRMSKLSNDNRQLLHNPQIETEHIKRSLLMREATLQKRRKAAEELLQWHQRLLEEEGKIAELELAASAIINQIPIRTESMVSDEQNKEKHKLKGSQLNLLWFNMTGREEKKFDDRMTYCMSKASLEKFCREARKYCNSNNSKKGVKYSESDNSVIKTDLDVSSLSGNRLESSEKLKSNSRNKESPVIDYSSDFESCLSDEKIEDEVGDNEETEPETIAEFSKVTKDVENKILPKNETVTEIIEDSDSFAFSKLDNQQKLDGTSKDISTDIDSDVELTKNEDLTISERDYNFNNSQLGSIRTDEISSEKSDSSSNSETVQELTKPSDGRISSKSKEIEEDLNASFNNIEEIEKKLNEIISNSIDSSITKTEEAKEDLNYSISKSTITHEDKTDTTEEKLNYSESLEVCEEEVQNLNSNPVSELRESCENKLDESRDALNTSISELVYAHEDCLSTQTSISELSCKENKEDLIEVNDECIETTKKECNQIKEIIAPIEINDLSNRSNFNEALKDEDVNTEEGSEISEDVHISNSEIQYTKTDIEEFTNGNESVGDKSVEISEFKQDSLNKSKVNLTVLDEIKAVSDHNDITENNSYTLNELSEENEDEENQTESESEEIDSNISVGTSLVTKEFSDCQVTEHISEEIMIEDNNSQIEEASLLKDKFSKEEEITDELEISGVIDENQKSDSEKADVLSQGQENRTEGVSSNKSLEMNLATEEDCELTELISDACEERSSQVVEEKLSVEEKTAELDECSLGIETDQKSDSEEVSVLSQEFLEISEKSPTKPDLLIDSQSNNSILINDKNTEDKSFIKSEEHVQKNTIDVKKRVSEILADAHISSPREDKSPRLQTLYVTAYDVTSPEYSSDSSGSPTNEPQSFKPPHPLYNNDEVEELLKKQLEIEQEIKKIQQQQRKEHVPYLYVREIPNKPPPPYTPPVTTQIIPSETVLPASEKQIHLITSSVAEILYKAYLDKNLQNVTLSPQDIKQMETKNNVEKTCSEFIFDLCKEAAVDHYKQFETETGPSWMHLTKHRLAKGKPFNKIELHSFISEKVKQWLGYETVNNLNNKKHKWSGKKRDHVDELLVVECQAEEGEWTSYDRDELLIKDELTRDIMNMLLSETAQVFNDILVKKAVLQSS